MIVQMKLNNRKIVGMNGQHRAEIALFFVDVFLYSQGSGKWLWKKQNETMIRQGSKIRRTRNRSTS